MSVRALAGEQGRDYKNVHRDVKSLERVGLIERTLENKVEVPWDIVEARLKLAARRCWKET
jgi:predicted transcriptional regulator